MRLSVLDQSPVISGHTPAQAIHETIRLVKAAEQFRMLEALYPRRIDLGIGRAPGGDQVTALAVGEGRYPGAERFPE